jgi:hypothetical protein
MQRISRNLDFRKPEISIIIKMEIIEGGNQSGNKWGKLWARVSPEKNASAIFSKGRVRRLFSFNKIISS